MPRDIFLMRDAARMLDVRNAYIAPDPEFIRTVNRTALVNHDDLAREGQWPVSAHHCICGNFLTVENRFNRCRQCMLTI